MSKKKQKTIKGTQSAAQRPWWLWAVLGGALLLIIGGVWLTWPDRPVEVKQAPNSVDPNFAPEVTGAPRLVVEQTTIDEGDVKVNTQIRTAYRLQNVGDQPLKILGEPAVELVEGC